MSVPGERGEQERVCYSEHALENFFTIGWRKVIVGLGGGVYVSIIMGMGKFGDPHW